ncbi:RHS repeat-associated core domain-containing protein [Pseudomonas sp. WJP1]|uniref:RHS repeat-associated core domain-containing protein n=1 Tax=Pseudomonas sp. WJP1 TaxID=2986947 RepID=UPI00234A7AF2|nr:RHS repeat-associated core domain-containing protein [Pseudomonas sp. WJP1]WCM49423.1 RHS repeat-associated core domain-containing protein [Pseudomonas sp. WJP1]
MSSQSRRTILLATDQQQSVLNVLDANQPNPIAFTPYGHRPRESGLLSLLGFNGELPDPLTGHYHLGKGYRQFNPVLMRYNSPDSLSPFGKGGINAYVYCLADPINSKDPTGHALVKSLMDNLGAIGAHTEDALRAAKQNLGGGKNLREIAKSVKMDPEVFLVNHATSRAAQVVSSNIDTFITDIPTLKTEAMVVSTRELVKYSLREQGSILYDLAQKKSILTPSNKIRMQESFKMMDDFHHGAISKISSEQIARIKAMPAPQLQKNQNDIRKR